MTYEQVCQAFVPSVSFKKKNKDLIEKRGSKRSYRGYKGVGLTFLAYGTDDVSIHSKCEGADLVRGRMQYGRAWAHGEREEPAQIVEDNRCSPLESYSRGTYIKVQFSPNTRPKGLRYLASEPEVWQTILRTRTAIGQILLEREAIVPIEVRLKVIDGDGTLHSFSVEPHFLFPHEVERSPAFRFMNVQKYWDTYGAHTELRAERLRQDGLYLIWNTEQIRARLIGQHKLQFENELNAYSPMLYAFIPYQRSLWREINKQLSGRSDREHLAPGLMLAVNRQRLADIVDIEATRYETLSQNILVVVHFDNAQPDQGRKTLQDEVLDLAKKSADRAVQYLAEQRKFLRAPGESPTPDQRESESSYADWIFNVKTHARSSPLHLPPATFASIPLTEQDVVGFFHQLSALGIFTGIEIFATSQTHTYDCLVRYNCLSNIEGLRYVSIEKHPLGLSSYIIGTRERFTTSDLTVEFKNNLDSLIVEFGDSDSLKSFRHIDICVCWSTVSESFKGYGLEEVLEVNLDERKYPGVTHLLSRDGEGHVIQVIMLERIVNMIEAGYINFDPR